MRKLKYTFSRTVFNQIYISYIRPVLEYSAIVWDGCTIQDKSAVPRRLFCFGSLVVLDVVFRYLSLFLLYINIKIGKNRC